MKAKNWLRRWKRSDDSGSHENQSEHTAAFRLTYNRHEMGTLEFVHDKWVFKYAEWIKNQSEIKPFANFPDLNKEYIPEGLSPFFESRLPGVSQPQVEDFLKGKEMTKEGDTKLALLKKFGRRSITNPFELQPIL